MGCLTFTINLKDVNDPDEPQQVVDDLKLLFKFLMNANPNYYLVGNMLYEQLDEQLDEQKRKDKLADPKEQMQKYFDSVCPISVDGDIASAGFWKYYNDLRNSIGEAMGPVSYAAFKLSDYIEAQDYPAYKKEHDAGTKWVWDFVKYYEAHWKF